MKILYATDGSPHAEAAAELLQRLPFPPNTEVVASSVLEDIPLSVRASEHIAPRILDSIHEERLARAKALVDAATGRLAQSFSTVSGEVLSGHAAHELTTLAQSMSADVIAIGARGLNVLERFLLGSTSENVIRHAPCSVLVAHQPDDSSEVTHVADRLRILVAYDGSPASDEAVDTLTRLTLEDTAEVELLYVHSLLTVYRQDVLQRLSEFWRKEEQTAREALDRSGKRLQAAGIRHVSTRVEEADDVPSSVLTVAREWQADLLLAGDTGKSGMDRFLLGSVCKRLARHAPCSVWVTRNKRAPE